MKESVLILCLFVAVSTATGPRVRRQYMAHQDVPIAAPTSNGSVVPGSRSINCNDSQVFIANACHPVVRNVGGICQYDEQCQLLLGGYSKCEATKCVCTSDAVPVLNNTNCHVKRNLEENCQYHEQCSHVLHGTCKQDVCLCDPGFTIFNKSCVGVVDNYNETCLSDTQCANGKLGYGSVCTGNSTGMKCTCQQEYFYKTGTKTCVYAKGLGEQCDGSNDDCYLHADGNQQKIQCKNKKCTCKKGYQPSEDNKQCGNAVVNRINYFVMILSLLIFTTRW